ncbi:alkaline phosphatase family protein [Kitasatospora sp. NPDC058965]|uniref:alkaline phosphatase family protein n=1 Tax=Kitasatospora sp. NPDC058965 TaxID=3346682 RepID=UPI0036818C30
MSAVVGALVAAVVAAGCSAGGPAEPSSVSASLSAQAGASGAGATAPGTVPRPAHVVVVVEENHSHDQVLGSPDAPYLTALAAEGASFSASYAVAHPSQPNYLALFSGSTQGLTGDSCPHRYSGATLASELLAAHLDFAGYAESMPVPGFTGCTSGDYARKHAPWANYPELPGTVSRTWAQWPSDYGQLPTVSFVVPNLQHDMHDGSVREGDDWLRSNLDGYLAWARSHDSLLVVTWDEDEGTSTNRIPTVVVGAGVRPGTYGELVDHYRVLRTLEDMYALPALGESAQRAPIDDIWAR